MNKSEIKVIKRDDINLPAKAPKGSKNAGRRNGANEVKNWIVERRENDRLESVILAEQRFAWHTSGK